jgi:C1A family cysteine protease
MKSKIIAIIILLTIITSSFGTIGSNINENNFSDYNCKSTTDTGNYDNMCGLLDDFSIHHDPERGETFVGNPPSSVDWTSRTFNGKTGDWMTSVKGQGGCGSCWAFAAIGVIEAMVNIKNKVPTLDLDLSEQYMVSCGDYEKYRMDGCDGAQMCRPFWESGLNYVDWTVFFDAIPEDCFDYTYSDNNCNNKCDDYYKQKVRVTKCGWIDTFLGNKDNIKNALNQKGPLVTRMEVYENFVNYGGGVYKKGQNPGQLLGGHAVVIVGYDDSLNCWKCKNSWGSWGDSGYFKIGYDECSINSDVMYIEVDEYVDPVDATVEFELYKIKKIDDIEHSDDDYADWSWEVSADENGKSVRYEDNHDSITGVSSYRWITNEPTVDITVKLKEIDDWPGNDDIADIGGKDSNGNSLHGNEPYDDKGERSWDSFPRAAYFKTTLDRTKEDLLDALTGDKITAVSESGWSGYKASGEFDGGSGDENDAEIWFNIHYKVTKPELEVTTDPNPLSWGSVELNEKKIGYITIKNVGGAGSTLNWGYEYDDSLTWLSCALNSGGYSLNEGETAKLVIKARASSEYRDSRDGTITITSNGDTNPTENLDVHIKTKGGKSKSLRLDLIELFKARFPWLFSFFVNLPNSYLN